MFLFPLLFQHAALQASLVTQLNNYVQGTLQVLLRIVLQGLACWMDYFAGRLVSFVLSGNPRKETAKKRYVCFSDLLLGAKAYVCLYRSACIMSGNTLQKQEYVRVWSHIQWGQWKDWFLLALIFFEGRGGVSDPASWIQTGESFWLFYGWRAEMELFGPLPQKENNPCWQKSQGKTELKHSAKLCGASHRSIQQLAMPPTFFIRPLWAGGFQAEGASWVQSQFFKTLCATLQNIFVCIKF